MDDDFYHFTIENSVLTNGIRHASPIALIALKARAYLNLTKDKQEGKHVNTKDIKKHRSDVLKNVVIAENTNVAAPESIKQCVMEFVADLRKNFGETGQSLAKSLDTDLATIEQLLEQLDTLFIA